MSLILDALNRSQDERRGESDVPGLETRHYPAPEAERATSPLLVAVLVVLVVLLGLVAYLLLGRDRAPSTPADEPEAVMEAPPADTPAVEASAAAQVVSPEPDSVLLSTAAQPTGGGGEVAALYDQAAPQQAEVTAEAPEPVDERVETRPAKPIEKAPAPPAEELVDLEQMVAIAEQEMENQRLEEHAAPFLSELSQQRKDAIPTLLYSRHDYAGDTRRSTIVINGKTLRAGSQVAPGIQLDEILPDSAVFSFRGEQFRLAALNSWVNL